MSLWFLCTLLSALETGLSVWCFIVGLTLRGIGSCGHTYLREQVNQAYSQHHTITGNIRDLYKTNSKHKHFKYQLWSLCEFFFYCFAIHCFVLFFFSIFISHCFMILYYMTAGRRQLGTYIKGGSRIFSPEPTSHCTPFRPAIDTKINQKSWVGIPLAFQSLLLLECGYCGLRKPSNNAKFTAKLCI